jgi:NAD(P)-dependent dehydrogenase (short-subunit alcohol dehydrogenase family)
MRTVVTGANRGIGLELVRQLRDRGDEVEACARTPTEARELSALAGDRVRIHPLEVTDPASVRALAVTLGDAAIDVVFNVAGVYGGSRQSLRLMADDLALPEVAETFDVNAMGALRVVLALLPGVRRGAVKKLAHVTSGMGSIADFGARHPARGRPRDARRFGRVPQLEGQPLRLVSAAPIRDPATARRTCDRTTTRRCRPG